MNKKNETGRSVHQSIKTLEEAVGTFIADVENRLDEHEAEKQKKTGRAGWFSITDVVRPLQKLRAAYASHMGVAPEIPRKPYERKVKKDVPKGWGSVEYEETHESYGMVEFSRVSGGRRLFGSSVNHQHYFRMSIFRGRRIMEDNGERFYTDYRVPIVEVNMSPAQFVELVTTMNIGSGIPCTLVSVEGVPMDETPEDSGSELKMMVEMFEDRLVETVDELRASDKKLEELLAKKTFTKDDKNNIRNIIHKVRRLMDDNAPHVLKIFGEHTEKMISKGKLEVESFVQLALAKAGIKAIRDSKGILLLGEGDADGKDGG